MSPEGDSKIEELQHLRGMQQLGDTVVPVTCGCTGNHSLANISYQINQGIQVVIPLFCKYPSKNQLDRGMKYLITHVWQPNDNDNVSFVSNKFSASLEDILSENNYGQNFTAASNPPFLIPVTRLPDLIQSPSGGRKHRLGLLVIIGINLGCTLSVVVSAILLVCVRCLKMKSLNRGASSTKTADKLLSGVSGHVNKPTMYETGAILRATMKPHTSATHAST